MKTKNPINHLARAKLCSLATDTTPGIPKELPRSQRAEISPLYFFCNVQTCHSFLSNTCCNRATARALPCFRYVLVKAQTGNGRRRYRQVLPASRVRTWRGKVGAGSIFTDDTSSSALGTFLEVHGSTFKASHSSSRKKSLCQYRSQHGMSGDRASGARSEGEEEACGYGNGGAKPGNLPHAPKPPVALPGRHGHALLCRV